MFCDPMPHIKWLAFSALLTLLMALALACSTTPSEPTPDIALTVEAEVQSAISAMPPPTPMPTYTPSPTYTPQPTYTPYPTVTPRPTPTPYPTATPRPTAQPYPTPTPQPTPTQAVKWHVEEGSGYRFATTVGGSGPATYTITVGCDEDRVPSTMVSSVARPYVFDTVDRDAAVWVEVDGGGVFAQTWWNWVEEGLHGITLVDGRFINDLIAAEMFELTIPRVDGNEVIEFQVSGLSEHISKANDLCPAR